MDESPKESVVVPARFEFSQEQNALIGDLSWKMRFIGTFLSVIGLLICVSGILQQAPGMGATFVQGFLFILLGVWTRQAGCEFQVIVDTKGEDVHHLMTALLCLKKCFTLQYWLVIIALAMLIVAWAILLFSPAAATVASIH